jgi:3-hydroxyisobutyrate dehydrogenase-like beta-hydroxyacid dehydrogenase
MNRPARVSLLGFGEVGQILAADLHSHGIPKLRVWDPLFADATSTPSRGLLGSAAVAAASAADAVGSADIVVSAVTATECEAAARTAAASIRPDAVFLDLNSVSPETKVRAAGAITRRGGRYIEAAVMSAILPKRCASPILLGGPHATEFLPAAVQLGFTGAAVFSDVIGRASAAKMCRSVLIKGLEALLTESLVAARRYGVETTVVESLHGLLPGVDWSALSRYMISRSLQHGQRRAAEMDEVAVTLRSAGIDPAMSIACAARQRWAADRVDAARHPSLEPLLDALLATVPDPRTAHTS